MCELKISSFWGSTQKFISILFCFVVIVLLIFTNPDKVLAQAVRESRVQISPQEFKERLKGPILSVPTAFTANGDIDFEGMGKMYKRAALYGCNIATLTFENSRYDRISLKEAKDLTYHMVESFGKKRVTIAATSMKWSLDSVLSYIEFAESIGVSAVQIDCPEKYLSANEEDSIFLFYKTISFRTKLGIVLKGYYSISLLKKLITIPSIVALKEDVKDVFYYVNRLLLFGDRLSIYAGGSDSRYLIGLPYGSPAYYSILYSWVPQIGLQFWQAVQKRDLSQAIEIANKYDRPFMKKCSFPFWAAAIEYFGGSQRYMRYKEGDNPGELTFDNKSLKEMYNFFDSMGVEPPKAIIEEGPSLPHDWKRAGHVGGKVENQVVITGGTQWNTDKTKKNYLNSTAVFSSGFWKAGPPLPEASAFSMFDSDELGLIVAGGIDSNESVLNSAYSLKSIDGEWQKVPPLPIKLGWGGGTLLKGKFYVACGIDEKGENQNSMWVIDTKDFKKGWKKCAPIPSEGRRLPLLVRCGDHLYLMGGVKSFSPLIDLNDVYKYYPEKDRWVRLNDLPIKGYAWVGKNVDDKNIIITGKAGKDKPIIWLFNVTDEKLTKIGENYINPATITPLVATSKDQWWFIGGEPDANRSRSEKVSIISLK